MANENGRVNFAYYEFAAFQAVHRRKTELHGGISVNYNNCLPSHLLYFQHKAQEKVLLFLELLLLESK